VLLGTRGFPRVFLDRVQARWRRHFEAPQQSRDAWPDVGRLADAGPGALVLDDLDRLERGSDVAPGVARPDLGDPLEQERDHRDSDVRLNAPGAPVEDRAHPQSALEAAPALLDTHELLVAERQISLRWWSRRLSGCPGGRTRDRRDLARLTASTSSFREEAF